MESIGSRLAAVEGNEPRPDVYLSRPENRNAMTVELIRDLTAALRTVSDADDVRAVTLLGEGSVFCAGMDLEMMRDRVEADSDVERDVFPDCSRPSSRHASRSSQASGGPRQRAPSS